ncbi:hypothetical protein D3C80_1673760 [compost metagenome]
MTLPASMESSGMYPSMATSNSTMDANTIVLYRTVVFSFFVSSEYMFDCTGRIFLGSVDVITEPSV